MSLFKELKRRNVIRVSAAYLVIGWLLVQIFDVLLPMFDVSESFQRGVVLLLLVGFIPTVIFSWAFEITPEGVKKEKDVVRDDSTTNITAKKLDYVTVAAALGVAGLFAWQQINPPASIPTNFEVIEQTANQGISTDSVTETDAASIAVLPFADLSPEKNQSHFSDGIAEEILNVLVRIESLKVASRTSAFGFKGQEALGIPAIAEKLKVRHVLEGSVRKSGNNVRITAQLIDAQSDTHLWSETYDRELTTENIFAVQDEIAGVIVKELGLIIEGGGDAEPQRTVTTKSVDAYELYLKANGLYHVRSTENIPEIVSLYEQAVAIDPNFAEAWAGLASVYLVVPGWNVGDEEEYYPKGKEAADRATELNDKLALPFTVRGGLLSDSGNMIGAFQELDKAIQLEPNNFQSFYFRGANFIDIGYLKQAEKDLRRCLELDPNYEICRRFLSFALLFQEDNETAAELFEDGMLKGQGSYIGTFVNYYGAIGDKSALTFLLTSMIEDNVIFRELLYRLHTDDAYSFDDFFKVVKENMPPDAPDEKIDLEWWEQGGFIGSFFWNPHQPVLRRPEMREEYLALRKKLLREQGIDDYWRKHGFPPQCKSVGEDDFECD